MDDGENTVPSFHLLASLAWRCLVGFPQGSEGFTICCPAGGAPIPEPARTTHAHWERAVAGTSPNPLSGPSPQAALEA